MKYVDNDGQKQRTDWTNGVMQTVQGQETLVPSP